MKTRTVSALGAAVVVLACSSLAQAQTVVVQPGQNQAPPPPPAPAPVVVQPAAPQPSTEVIQTAPPATTTATTEATPHSSWRPNRTLLMTGLVLLGAPYVASVGVAATSGHNGDGNLAVPVLGPWLDMGSRGGCPSGSDCSTETGDQVLLAADGILQTVGALEIVGAFVFPEHYQATTITTGQNTSMTLAPSRVGPGAYGLSAVGNF
ncbi:MAG TPA: hypothetical protein VF765_22520 [Polyangiaceae bacterium]